MPLKNTEEAPEQARLALQLPKNSSKDRESKSSVWRGWELVVLYSYCSGKLGGTGSAQEADGHPSWDTVPHFMSKRGERKRPTQDFFWKYWPILPFQ